MKKVKKDDLEYLYDTSSELFGSKYTIQSLYISFLLGRNISSISQLTDSLKNNIKRKYLLWQSHEVPSMKWICEDYQNGSEITEFSHENDLTWNSIDDAIVKYFMIYVNEIGCKTKQESLREEFLASGIGMFD